MGLRAEFASVNVITQKNVVEETSRWPRKFLARMMKVMIKIGLHMIKKESTRTRSVRKSFMSWRETWYKTESLTEGCLPRGRSLCLQFLAIWNTNKIILDNTAILYFVTLHLSLSLSLSIYIYIYIYIYMIRDGLCVWHQCFSNKVKSISDCSESFFLYHAIVSMSSLVELVV